jgi:hypothetical protein
MLFVLSFVIIALLIPLSVEIYKGGPNNILTRSGKEIAESRLVKHIKSMIVRRLVTDNQFMYGGVAVLGVVIVVWISFSIGAIPVAQIIGTVGEIIRFKW